LNRIVVSEYCHLIKQSDSIIANSFATAIPDRDFEYLSNLLYSSDLDDEAHRFFLKPAILAGRPSLQIQSHVGVLNTPHGTQLEILPKIFNRDGREFGQVQVKNILIRMLCYLRSSPFRQSKRARLIDVSMPLMEVFLGYFLDQVNKIVKKGIRSDYVRQQENLFFMKGKLLIPNQIRANMVCMHRFYIEYDEYLMDRPENRLVRSALEVISSFTRMNSHQRLCRELLFYFDSVPPSNDYRNDLSLCTRDRSMAYYENVLDWCRLILSQQSPTASTGSIKSISLLFPMERIFEDYVAARLKKQFPDWRITSQAGRYYLLKQHGRNYYMLRPDLVVEKGLNRVVADTKWKLLGGDDTSKPAHSIDQADLYQMFAYGHKYLKDQEVKEVYLIYPKTINFNAPLPPFDYEDGFKLFVVPYDLSPEVDALVVTDVGSLSNGINAFPAYAAKPQH